MLLEEKPNIFQKYKYGLFDILVSFSKAKTRA